MLARELAHSYAASGWHIILAGRDGDELSRVASDVTIRQLATVEIISVDLTDAASIDAAAVEVSQKGIPKIIIFVAGVATGLSEAPYERSNCAKSACCKLYRTNAFGRCVITRLETLRPAQ